MTAFKELIEANQRYARDFEEGHLPAPPSRRVAVVTCMDARLAPEAFLGLGLGEAHVIRNAGGVVTEDVIRSLTISRRFLGTEEIMIVHHTDCGMLTFSDDAAKRQIQEEVGIKPEFALEAFPDLEEDVRQSIRRVQASPFLQSKNDVRGFVYEVESGRLREVT